MAALIENVLFLLIFGVIGWALGETHILSSQNLKLLSVLEVWVFLPCNALQSFSRNFTADYIRGRYPLILVSTGILVALIFLTKVIVPRFVKEPYRQNILRYALTISTFGYMGFPLIQGTYGDLMLLNAQVFALPMSIYTNSEGYRMLTNSGKFSAKSLINPSVVAIVVGCILGLTETPLPSVFSRVVESGSDCMGPISMLLAGITISDYHIKQMFRDKQAYIVSAFRLLVIPITLCLILSLFCSKETVMIAVILYAMPCGLNTVVFPRMIGEDCRPGAAMALISTVACLVTIPVCMKILELICG